MKTDLNPTAQYQPPKALTGPQDVKSKKDPLPKADALKENPDYKLDLSTKLSAPSPAPSVPEVSAPKVEDVAVNVVKDEIKQEVVQKLRPEERPGTLKKDAIIFIKGLDVFSSPSKSESGYAGVGRMAESITGARLYGWNQKSEIMKEILKVHPDNKIVLVGHSFGGDTAVELADELNSLENKFRNVDLLITMDSVGFGNDVIPQNVKKHLNIFGENDIFLNDGPHVARRHDKTSVINLLSPRDHTEIDDDKEVQYEVVNLIQKTLSGAS